MITLSSVSKRFDRDFVVSGISLTIQKGEIVGILGPNGAGKTTTLRMLVGVLPPSKGSIVIDALSMQEHAQSLKKRIGYLPENNPLYDDMTVEESMRFCARLKGLSAKNITEAIDRVIAKTGIAEVYYRVIGQLSKGYRQRVGLAQALLGDPDILILDEPTEGLDPNQRHDIQILIKRLGKDHTILISSHVLSEIARMCTRIIIINKGMVVADSPPEKLKIPSTSLRAGKSKVETAQIEVEIRGDGVMAVLKKLKEVVRVEQERSNYFTITSTRDIREDIFKCAQKEKWTLLTLLKKEQGLEEVFRQLTTE